MQYYYLKVNIRLEQLYHWEQTFKELFLTGKKECILRAKFMY